MTVQKVFTAPILLPGDPSLNLQAATKQYADGKVPGTRNVNAGTGLTGGGDLSADRTLTVAYGTSGTTACVGNDSRLSDSRTPTAHKSTHATGGTDALAPSDIGAVPTTRNVNAGTGLTGGGALSSDITISASFGSASGTICQGSDSRLSDSRTPSGTAGGALNGTYPNPNLDAVPFPPSTITYAGTISADPTLSNNFNVTATGAITSLGVSATGATDGQMVTIAVLASGAARAVTPATGTIGIQTVSSGAVGFFGFRYTSLLGTPAFVCIAYQASA